MQTNFHFNKIINKRGKKLYISYVDFVSTQFNMSSFPYPCVCLEVLNFNTFYMTIECLDLANDTLNGITCSNFILYDIKLIDECN